MWLRVRERVRWLPAWPHNLTGNMMVLFKLTSSQLGVQIWRVGFLRCFLRLFIILKVSNAADEKRDEAGYCFGSFHFGDMVYGLLWASTSRTARSGALGFCGKSCLRAAQRIIRSTYILAEADNNKHSTHCFVLWDVIWKHRTKRCGFNRPSTCQMRQWTICTTSQWCPAQKMHLVGSLDAVLKRWWQNESRNQNRTRFSFPK